MVLTKENVSFAFVIGGPGSGKSTQAAKIAETFGYVSLHAMHPVLDLMASGSEYGNWLLDGIKAGTRGNLPAGEVVELLKKEIESSQSHKFLIHGFPPDVEHGIAFDEIVGVDPDVILFLDCPEKELLNRLLNDKENPLDAYPEAAFQFVELFNEDKLPVLNYYLQKGVNLHMIDGARTIDEVFESVRPIFAALEEEQSSKRAASITAEQKYKSLSSEFSKLQSKCDRLQSSLDQLLAEKHQLHLQSIAKDAEIKRLLAEVSELHIS